MTKILHLICSPLGKAAQSYKLSRKIVDYLVQQNPTATVIDRPLYGDNISNVDGEYAAALGATHATAAEISQQGSFALSETLIQELEGSDFLVIGTPMHNFTVPSGLKAWIDHIIRVRRTFDVTAQGKVAKLRDRPVFICVVSGGRYSEERARQPDFLTPYLKATLEIIGLNDLTFFSIEGTGSAPDAVAQARARTDQAMDEYFSSLRFSGERGALGPVATCSEARVG